MTGRRHTVVPGQNRTQKTRSSILSPRAWAALAAASAALLPASAYAASASERRTVMLGTTVAIVIALALCAVGYAYRRVRGMDHPTPDELQMMGGDGHGEAVHGHAEAEHGTVGERGMESGPHGAAAAHH